MLSLAAQRAPEISRQLTLIVLQFLSPEQIEPRSACRSYRFRRHRSSGTKATGLHAFGGGVAEQQHWLFGAAVGLEALYADADEMAVGMQGELE